MNNAVKAIRLRAWLLTVLKNHISNVTPAQVPSATWVEPRASTWMTAVRSWSTHKICSSGLSMGQSCVPVHRDLQWVWLWPHTECVLGMCMASSSSAMCAGRSTGWLAEGYQNLLKATSTFHTAWRRRELSSSQLPVVPGRHFCAADTTNCKYRTAGHSLPARAQEDSHTASAAQ